jgi:tetratricopeptide (TPR) repeat protein
VLAAMLADGGQPAEALRYWRQARAASGDSSAYASQIVAAYEAAGDVAGAVREIVDELGRRPKAFPDFRQRIAAHASRGSAARLLAEVGRIPDATTRARAHAAVYLATRRVPEAVRVMKGLGDRAALLQFGRECEDESTLEAAAAVYRDLEMHVDAARVLRRLGRSSEARRELEQTSGVEAQVELGSLLLEGREFERAAAVFESALRQRPGDEAAAFGLGSARLGQGRLAEARTAALGRGQQSDRLLLLVARSHFYAGDFDSCRVRVMELARRFPRSALVNDGLELAVVAGAGDRAGELARAMLDFEVGDDAAGVARARALTGADTLLESHALLLLARFDLRQGRPRDALARLDTLVARYPAGPLAPRAEYDKAVIYRDELHDDAKYKEALERLVLTALGSPWAPVARSLLAEANQPVGGTDIR